MKLDITGNMNHMTTLYKIHVRKVKTNIVGLTVLLGCPLLQGQGSRSVLNRMQDESIINQCSISCKTQLSITHKLNFR